MTHTATSPRRLSAFAALLVLAVLVLFLGASLASAGEAKPSLRDPATRLLSVGNPNPVPQATGWPAGGANLGTAKVQFSSPVLYDTDGNGSKEAIFVGTSDGYLVKVRGTDGTVVWKKRLADFGYNDPGCGVGITRSSPAVGMLRAPGGSPVLAVVIGTGDYPFTNSTGGVLALRADTGSPLWFYKTGKYENWPDCSNGVVASPTITDVDKDGDNEVLFGSFDHGFYILNNDGTNYPAWPQWFLDTHWSSPAVGDIDNDGQNEIIVASDEGRVNHGCPYALEWPQDYCGGSLYAMRLDGTWLSAFPYYTWQAIQSPPVLADLNGDGYLDIIFGTGTYYAADTAASNFDTFRLFAIDYRGQNLPGWPVNLNGVTDGEPAVGDLNDDGSLDVVMGTSQYYCHQSTCGGVRQGTNIGYVYAFRSNGMQLWAPRQMKTTYNNSYGSILWPMIADYDDSGDMDIVFSLQWEVQIIDGDTGAYEIGGYGAANDKVMYGNYTIDSAPAVGDVNGDGTQEIVAAGATNGSGATGAVYAWRSSTSTGAPVHAWPMFRGNAAHTARFALPTMAGAPNAITQLHRAGATQPYTFVYPIVNLGESAFTFTTSDTSPNITVQPASTVINPAQTRNMTVTLNLSSYGTPGTFTVGTITLQGTYGAGVHALGSPRTVTVTAIVANTVYDVFIPLIQK